MLNTPENTVEAHAVPATDDWQTPDFTVVDTALEVTAYSLRTR